MFLVPVGSLVGYWVPEVPHKSLQGADRIWAPGLGWGTTFLNLGCREDVGSRTGVVDQEWVADRFPEFRVPTGFGLRDWGGAPLS